MTSPHNGSGNFAASEDDLTDERFNARMATGDMITTYARTGFLGFIKRTDFTQTDGGKEERKTSVLGVHVGLGRSHLVWGWGGGNLWRGYLSTSLCSCYGKVFVMCKAWFI